MVSVASRPAGDPVSVDLLREQLQELGVYAGAVLLVHTSFRAVRPVVGGPAGLIEALRDMLGPEGALVMPSWSSAIGWPSRAGSRRGRSGMRARCRRVRPTSSRR